MINKIIRATYFVILGIVFTLTLFFVWTSFVFISQPLKSREINVLVKDMYQSQKSFAIDTIELAKILSENRTKVITNENKDLDTYDTLLESNNIENSFSVEIEPLIQEDGLGSEGIEFSTEDLVKPDEEENNLSGLAVEPLNEKQDIENEGLAAPQKQMNMNEFSILDAA